LQILRSLDESRWKGFLESQPTGNIFHTPEMFRVFEQANRHEPELWAVANNNRVLALFLPVQITLRNGILHKLTTRAVAYGSVLYEPGHAGREALAFLLQTYRQKRRSQLLFTELRNLADMNDVQPVLGYCGFVYEDHLNYVIDLTVSPDKLMQNIGRRTRKHIRRGLSRREVIVEEVTQRSHIAVCYELIRRSYATAQVPLASVSLFEKAATSVELAYKETIYGWYSGVDRNYSNYTPNELLMWHILEYGAENSYKAYDFGGAGKPDEEYGVRDFKAKFGGELVNYGRNVCVHSPALLTLSKAGYAIYRRLIKVT
jgi:serine/alanine adding enzyme